MNIKLGSSTRLQLSGGLFNNNTINSLTITGNYKEGEQVEISTDALKENNGPYPDINIQNVFTVIVRTKAFSGNFSISLQFQKKTKIIYIHIDNLGDIFRKLQIYRTK